MILIEKGVSPIVSEILLIIISTLLVTGIIFWGMDILNNSHINGKINYMNFMLNENRYNISLIVVSGNISVPFVIYITNFNNVSVKINIYDLSILNYSLNLYGKNLTMYIFSLNRYYLTGGDYITFINIYSLLTQNEINELHFIILYDNNIIVNQLL
ncbi:MAG: hypothetical protein ACP5JE_03505 [Thermoplasmata archaeon]